MGYVKKIKYGKVYAISSDLSEKQSINYTSACIESAIISLSLSNHPQFPPSVLIIRRLEFCTQIIGKGRISLQPLGISSSTLPALAPLTPYPPKTCSPIYNYTSSYTPPLLPPRLLPQGQRPTATPSKSPPEPSILTCLRVHYLLPLDPVRLHSTIIPWPPAVTVNLHWLPPEFA